LNWRKKVRLAKEKGAIMAFIVDPNFSESIKANRRLLSAYGWQPVSTDVVPVDNYINNAFISPEMAKNLFGKKAEKAEHALEQLRQGKGFKPVSIKQKMEINLDKENRKLEGANVIGFIEGIDPDMKDDYVFVTAHYDHLGMADTSVIYYGADDNASGSSGVVEIARAFAAAKKAGKAPKRSVVCMLVSGEEKGLLGSRYYVDLPLFPLDRTIVDINIDMIGRVDAAHQDKPDYIYVIGSDRLSTQLHEINEQINEKYVQLALDYKYNALDDPNRFYERSDHYNFAQRGIPAIFFFNGVHPDYHKPTDTPDKINTELLAKRARLAFYNAWEIANRPTRLSVDKK
jgi:Zn-dependent M28 family amino/carboxypeptidase